MWCALRLTSEGVPIHFFFREALASSARRCSRSLSLTCDFLRRIFLLFRLSNAPMRLLRNFFR